MTESVTVPFPGVLIKPVSSECNLRCDYCYYQRLLPPTGKKPLRKIAPATVERFFEGYLVEAGPEVSIGWQGGEPLLAGLTHFKATLDILHRHRRPDQRLRLAFQTNGGGLTREWARVFCEHDILVGVSLDGPPEMHNAHRFRLPGRGNDHARALAGLQLLLDEGVEVNALTVLTPANAADPAGLYHYLRSHGVRHMQFIPCLEPRADGAPGIAPFALPAEMYTDFLLGVLAAWRDENDPDVSVRMLGNALGHFLGFPPELCLLGAACAELTLEANGDVFACDHFVLPHWKLGNVARTPVREMLYGETYRRFIVAGAQAPAECRSCRWREICGGGCPKHRLIGSGQWDGPNYYCSTFLRFFDAAHDAFTDLRRARTPGIGAWLAGIPHAQNAAPRVRA